jgi:hypothetical protein
MHSCWIFNERMISITHPVRENAKTHGCRPDKTSFLCYFLEFAPFVLIFKEKNKIFQISNFQILGNFVLIGNSR